MDRKKIVMVYLAGLLQGLALVAFPATSSIFTGANYFNFSSASYGSLFVPQAIFSIIASLVSAKLTARGKIKNVFFIGLFANLLSMTIFALSASLVHEVIAYWILLLATGLLGIGFGLTVPALNTFAAQFFPNKTASAILILNGLLGLGTALAPILVALFIGFSIWWGLPTLLAFLILILFLLSFSLSWQTKEQRIKRGPIPAQFWMFAGFALLYGMIETINGNWATVYMLEQNATPAIASLALTLFWSMVTLGRLIFAPLSGKFTFRLIPFLAALSFILLAMIPKDHPYWGVFVFGLAGIGCSALLPLTISFGAKVLPSSAGFLVAFYLLGYGLSAFGVGEAKEICNFQTIFGASTILALLLGGLSFKLTH